MRKISAYPVKVVQARVPWIDDVKGIGIILVVAGHTIEAYTGTAYRPIYLFHMPLFFFMAGVVFRPEPFAAYAGKRVRTLLVPYAAFLALLLLAKVGLALAHGEPLQAVLEGQVRDVVDYLYGGRALMGDYGIAWFVTCLFAALLVYDALRIRFGNPWTMRFAGVMACCFAGAYWIGRVGSPWDLTVVPMALVFVWLGELWSSVMAVGLLPAEGRLRLDGPVAIAAAAVVAAAGLLWARPFDMKYGDYGTPVLSVLAALGCIHLLALACRALSVSPAFNAVLEPLGRASLVVYFLHRFVILHVHDRIAPVWAFAVALALPFLAYLLLRSPGAPTALRRAFLGERPAKP